MPSVQKIGVFTSGGDAPGMNACIRAVVRTALYHQVAVWGIYGGYQGMIEGQIEPLTSRQVSNIIQRGGTILKTARSAQFMTPEGRKTAHENLQKQGIEGLIAIGGDGTFTGAKQFFEEYGIPTIGCPGTIDNDLFGTDYTIGFDTAVNTALEAIDKIRDTAASHNRIFFVEVMGRDSGYIALHTGISGGAELVMIPETTTTIAEVVETISSGKLKHKNSAIVLVAEGDEEGNAQVIAAKVKEKLPDLDIRVSVLGHIQRGGSPTAQDRILASRLGVAATEALLAGESNQMVGIINGKINFTPFGEAIKAEKPLQPDLLRLMEVLSI